MKQLFGLLDDFTPDLEIVEPRKVSVEQGTVPQPFASEAKQSSFAEAKLDCFVASLLAMTTERPPNAVPCSDLQNLSTMSRWIILH